MISHHVELFRCAVFFCCFATLRHKHDARSKAISLHRHTQKFAPTLIRIDKKRRLDSNFYFFSSTINTIDERIAKNFSL